MGFVSTIFVSIIKSFGKIASDKNISKSAKSYNNGQASFAFANIINAHSSVDEIVDEFELDQPGCGIEIPYLGMCAYDKAVEEYEEELLRMVMQAVGADSGDDGDDEDDDDSDGNLVPIEERAYKYATEYVERILNHSEWIPGEMLEWAFYDVSDHNKR